MGQASSVKKNFVMNVVLTMSSFIFPLITFPYISRILLPAGTGKVSFATSLISYFNMFAQLGIPTYGICACAKVRDNRKKLTRTAHELLMINLFMSAISYIILILGLIFVPRLREERTLYVIVSFTIILSAVGMEWLYKAIEQYAYITVRSIIFKLAALAAMFLLIHEQDDYVIYGGISILAASASNIMNLLNVHKYIDMRPVGHYRPMRHMKAVAVFFAMACATTIYTNLDTVMLGFMASDEAVGYYNAAVKIKTILVGIVTSLGTVLLPRASYYVEQRQFKEFRRITRKSLNFVFVTATPLMLYFIIFARQGIYFLSGTAYEGAVVPMQIIMPTLLLIGITNVLGIQILVPLGKEKIVLYSEIMGAATDCVLNFILIPELVAAGAAAGTLTAELVVLIVQCTALWKVLKKGFFKVSLGKVILALMLGSAASVWVTRIKMDAFAALFISAALFFGVYGISLLVTGESLTREIVGQLLKMIEKKSCRNSAYRRGHCRRKEQNTNVKDW